MINSKNLKKKIDEQVAKYATPSCMINDIYGDMAWLIENEDLINKVRDLYFILNKGRIQGFDFRNGNIVLAESWSEFEASIENLIVKMEAYKQVIESKLQDPRNNSENVMELPEEEDNAMSAESKLKGYSVWRPVGVKNGASKLNMQKPDWANKLKMKLVNRCGLKWSINGEVIQDDDLLLKHEDTVELLHHVTKYDVWE